MQNLPLDFTSVHQRLVAGYKVDPSRFNRTTIGSSSIKIFTPSGIPIGPVIVTIKNSVDNS